jgi:predicted phage terminase large subunit-like protein
MVLDAAQEAKERADYSAFSVWGVFHNEEPESDRNEIILLDAVRERVDFPSLKKLAMRKYEEYEPDSFLIEKKSSGVALFQELRRMGLCVAEFTPHRGTGDKTARLNGVSDMIQDGLVWVPETRWAEELVDEVVSYPTSSNDDYLDTMVMALARFRQGAMVRVSSDRKDEPSYFKGNRRGGYY